MYNNQQLLTQLSHTVSNLADRAVLLQRFTQEQLNTRPSAERWSVSQVIAHLSFYNQAYLPRIKAALQQQPATGTGYAPGWLGNYFTRLMTPLPDGQLPSRMQAPTASVPPADLDAYRVLDGFIAEQKELLRLLNDAAAVHLGKIRIATTLSSLLKLKLGDTFRFLVAHQQRHFIQIENVLKETGVYTADINL